MKKKVLITGSNGLLGQKLVEKLSADPEFELIATSRGDNRCPVKEAYTYFSLDISNRSEVLDIFSKTEPHVIINTAAMTNVDACESKKEECLSLNVEAVKHLAEASKKYNSHLIHISTDFIFDGEDGPYSEDAEPAPLSFYGNSKLEGEKVLLNSGLEKWAILRTVLVFGVVSDMSRSNIVLWAKESLEQRKNIKVVDDQFRTPTLAEDLADGCILAARKGAKGIYNISGKDFMSVYDLVLSVADFWKLDRSLITKTSSDTLSQAAKRPPITGFILNKAMKELGYNPKSFTEGLAVVDEQLKLKQVS